METPFDFGDKKVNCEKHGKQQPSIEYMVDHEVFIRVCFKCYAEKHTEGLKNYAKSYPQL